MNFINDKNDIDHKKLKKIKLQIHNYEYVPKEWHIAKIQECAKISTGTKNTVDKEPNGKFPFFVRSLKIEKINDYSYDGEAVITAGDGMIGKIFHYMNGKFEAHQRVYVINKFNGLLDGKYFYYYFSKYFFNRAMSMSAKTTVDSIRMSMIADMLIPLPSIIEQRKIALILSNVDVFIESIKECIGKNENLKKGLMQEILINGIKHNKFKKIPCGFKKNMMPYEWELIKLKTITLKIIDKDHTTPTYTNTDGISLISPKDFTKNSINFSRAKTISRKQHKEISKRCLPSYGDILFSRLGTIGKVRLVPKNKIFNILHSIVLIRPNEQFVDKKYLYYVLQSKFVQDQINREIQSIGTPDLGINKIRNLQILIPPLYEQRNISLILSKLDLHLEEMEKYENKLKILKNGLLQKLLTGKIRVNS